MRPGSVEDDVVIGENVDVERPRPPPPLMGAVAAEGAFDLLRPRQQRLRREPRLGLEAEIDERRLVLDPPRRRRIVGRAGDEAHVLAVAEHRDGMVERVADLADIAAERQQRLSHDASARA